MGTCRERLVAEGVALGAYDSVANAADVEDLRRALGYEQWNLYGISYGTRLALTVMRDYPQRVRSAILDSAYPPQANIVTETPGNFQRALDVFFAGCAADTACNEAYPELEPFFFDLVEQLDAQPITVEVVHAFEREQYDVRLAGEDLLGIVFQGLYSEEIIPLLPQMIYETAEGHYELLRGLLANLIISNEFSSIGMNFSVQCQEEIAFSAREEVAAAVEELPELEAYFETSATSGEIAFEVCELWDVAAAPAEENESVRSDVPALVLAGEYDPITPPAWGQEVQAGLENSYYFEFPGLGHGVSVSGPCPLAITLAFLENPDRMPNGGCVAAMAGPLFLTPQMEVVAEPVPFTTDLFGLELTGVAPEGWEEVSPGVFARERTVLDPTFVLQQAVPGVPAQDVLQLLVEQLDIEETPVQVRTVNAGGKTWALYETVSQGTPVDIALSEDGGMTFVVMLLSSEGERDVLYEAVYLRALERLEVG
jgi:pimeloyl-ACP methyl ester carboxylesterase